MTPTHVFFFRYDPQTKQHVKYDALVIGSASREDHDREVLTVAFFKHDDIASHHALNGIDWADTFERVFEVPHQDDKVNQSFYWVEGDEVELKKKSDWLRKELEKANTKIEELTPKQTRAEAKAEAAQDAKDAKAEAKADAKAAK